MSEFTDQTFEKQRDVSELHARNFTLCSAIQQARALRGEFLPARLFGDPAWDILLDLYEAELAQFRLTISKVCVGTGLPATTTLRWLKILENEGLLQRRQDVFDGRRVFVSPTLHALEALDALFQAIGSRLPDPRHYR